jgi:hypothetical protein
MTVDLITGPVDPGLRWSWHRGVDSVPNGVSLHIDAEKPDGPQQYNRFEGFFADSEPPSNICNFTFDTPGSGPYKRGSHGERGVPKTSRVIAAQGFATQSVPGLPTVSARASQEVVVRSMHCLLGKGYAGGGGRLRFGANVSAVASSECPTQVGQE